MSDPIVDILKQISMCSGYGFEFDDAAKQIRQQIGRELLERRRKLDEFVKDEFLHVRDIQEVCKLEEE